MKTGVIKELDILSQYNEKINEFNIMTNFYDNDVKINPSYQYNDKEFILDVGYEHDDQLFTIQINIKKSNSDTNIFAAIRDNLEHFADTIKKDIDDHFQMLIQQEMEKLLLIIKY